MTDFTGFGLHASLLRGIREAGYETTTPIQKQAIPAVLSGRDLVAIAQTGTGKTAAFSLPILHRLLASDSRRTPRRARTLVLAPTRELAIQIGDNIASYSKHLDLATALVYGGASANRQISALSGGVDILVATPGRLLDLMAQKHIHLDKVECLVLDEADRMLDMGFIRDIRKIVAALPTARQTLLFSATMPAEVENLANSLLHAPARIEVTPAATTAEKVTQHVLMVARENKRALLGHILEDEKMRRVLIFTRTKHGANRLTRQLEAMGVPADVIHGNKSQNARQKALAGFRTGDIRALVATDIAARGIDIDDITHVINYELPNEPESYVHRIGRTARAGATGASLSFCDAEERALLKNIEKSIRQAIPVLRDQPFHMENAPAAASNASSRASQRSGRGNGGMTPRGLGGNTRDTANPAARASQSRRSNRNRRSQLAVA